MPKLWDASIDGHRRTMQAAILDATAALVAERGLAAVTMSQIARRTGIGRATLYKHFRDVEAIVAAWHERQVSEHLHQLTEVAATVPEPGERLRAVLTAYADRAAAQHSTQNRIAHPPELALPLHRSEHVAHARRQLHALITDLVRAAGEAGAVRTDMPADELATYCLHALGAATETDSAPARQRLVAVTLRGLDTAAR